MRTQYLAASHNQLLAQRNVFLGVALIVMVANVLLSGVTYYLVGKQRIVVTPAVVTNAFWVSGDTVSESYLEQMAGFFVGLVLNVSPNSFSTRTQQLLQHVHPKAFASVKSQMVAQQQEIERRAMSTSFHATHFTVNREKCWVEVSGELRIMIGGVPLELKNTAYQLQFIQDQGRLYITEFQEVQRV